MVDFTRIICQNDLKLSGCNVQKFIIITLMKLHIKTL